MISKVMAHMSQVALLVTQRKVEMCLRVWLQQPNLVRI